MMSEIDARGEFPVYMWVLEEIARSLVDDPQRLEIEELRGEAGRTVVLTVTPSDLSNLIGKQGRTVRSLQLILSAMARKAGRRVLLEVRSGEDRVPSVVDGS